MNQRKVVNPKTKRAVKPNPRGGQGTYVRNAAAKQQTARSMVVDRIMTDYMNAATDGSAQRQGAAAAAARVELAENEKRIFTANGIERFALAARRLELRAIVDDYERTDLDELERLFIANAAEYSQRKGISYAAWIAHGVVDPEVLDARASVRDLRNPNRFVPVVGRTWCFIHSCWESVYATNYRLCAECGHSYFTPLAVLHDHNEALLHLWERYGADAGEAPPKKLDDAASIVACPWCGHDF